ncbi:MAG: UDP-N-acetylmuramate dehydrogenase [candidate division KSB1 bacterium]|nr:UDP-N-acetylmuramate dehydrogenase [candidate division KSB1 bacterium]
MQPLEFPPNLPVRMNVSLADYTNIHIGGPADYLIGVRDQNIFIELYHFCKQRNLRFLPLGDGTNVFFPETGYRGLVAVIRFDAISLAAGNTLVTEAGASLAQISEFCIDNRLTGFEFLSGIPGTIGGAVFGNAGAYGDNVGNHLVRAKIMDANGDIRFVDASFFQFRYRHSFLKETDAWILQAEFQLEKGDRPAIRDACHAISEKRSAKLPPPETKTAGSWFKNIKDEHGNATAAAKFLDAVGSKQTHVGDAAVHPKHANIFFNKSNATAQDMLELERILQKRVQVKFGIKLEREVMYLN